MTHYFRIKHALWWQTYGFDHHPRFKDRCKVLTKGRNGNLLIEFEDGERMVTPRFSIRRLAP